MATAASLLGITLVGTIFSTKVSFATFSIEQKGYSALDRGPYVEFEEDPAVTIPLGGKINGWTLDDVQPRKVRVHKGRDVYWLDTSEGFGDIAPGVDDIKIKNEDVIISRDLHEQIIGSGLTKILMQAATIKVGDGYMITDIDKGSIYDLAGLKDGDIIQYIDGVELVDPWTAVKALKVAARADEVSVAFWREGVLQKRRVVIR
jgi:hypothetical protein